MPVATSATAEDSAVVVSRPTQEFRCGDRSPMAPRIRAPSQRVDGFSKLALTTFKQMLKLEGQWEGKEARRHACRDGWENPTTHPAGLELPPGCYPAVEHRDTRCPSPGGSPMARRGRDGGGSNGRAEKRAEAFGPNPADPQK